MTVNEFSDSGRIQRRIWVSGRVQGVAFRASTLAEARRLGTDFRGYVRNLEDGRVEAVISGQAAQVLALVAWCRKGPPSALVTRLEVVEEAVDNSLPPFEISL